MVTTSGLTHAPLTRLLLLALIASSLATSILDLKHFLPIKPTPHLYPYLQVARLLTFQTAFTSTTELLVACALLYRLRAVERLWGTRKYASFVAVCVMLAGALVPATALVLKILTLGAWNYVPAGAVPVVFAALAAWADEVPRLYRWKIVGAPNLVLSDKSTTYVLAAQLALSQFPYQLVPAGVGWMVGSAWVGELLPGGMGWWRVPAWMVGEARRRKERGQYEGLRRRLEEEGSAGDGMRNVSDQAGRHEAGAGATGTGTRGFAGMVAGYFTGS